MPPTVGQLAPRTVGPHGLHLRCGVCVRVHASMTACQGSIAFCMVYLKRSQVGICLQEPFRARSCAHVLPTQGSSTSRWTTRCVIPHHDPRVTTFSLAMMAPSLTVRNNGMHEPHGLASILQPPLTGHARRSCSMQCPSAIGGVSYISLCRLGRLHGMLR